MYDYEHMYRTNIDFVYPPLMGNDGVSTDIIFLAEQNLGLSLPKALRDYYALTGNRKDITKSYNRLLNIEEISLKDNTLVFFEENQAVFIWGIQLEDLFFDNPVVFVSENTTRGVWRSIGDTVSVFLVSMLYWQAVNGGLPYIGVASRTRKDIKSELNEWPRIELGKYFDDMEMFATSGKVVCVARKNRSVDIYAGARSRDDFIVIDQLIGIEWDYSTIYDE